MPRPSALGPVDEEKQAINSSLLVIGSGSDVFLRQVQRKTSGSEGEKFIDAAAKVKVVGYTILLSEAQKDPGLAYVEKMLDIYSKAYPGAAPETQGASPIGGQTPAAVAAEGPGGPVGEIGKLLTEASIALNSWRYSSSRGGPLNSAMSAPEKNVRSSHSNSTPRTVRAAAISRTAASNPARTRASMVLTGGLRTTISASSASRSTRATAAEDTGSQKFLVMLKATVRGRA